MSNASRLAGRKEKKVRGPRAARRILADDPRYTNLLPAIVDGNFIAPKDSTVHVIRHRNGADVWHRCTVMKITGTWIELWDELLGQWFCFDTSEKQLPDVRLSV